MPITTKNELQGGQQTSPNRAPAARVIASGLASQRVANALIAALGGVASSVVIAAHTSTTTDWASLQVGDILVHIPATAGNTSFETVAAAGTKPSASVVGDLYIVLRAVNLDSNNPVVGKTLNGRTTDGF